MLVFPNSKINLGLQIVRKREDGFHDIETCLYPLQLIDALEVLPTTDKTSFALTGLMINDDGKENLSMQAYRLLKEHYSQIGNIKMHLHKVIPAGAGLGGGSSDASYTIKLLNDLYALGMRNAELQHFARQLGSDCPFFIENKPVRAYGKGDEFEEIDVDLAKYNIAVIKPAFSISTKEAYGLVKPSKSNTCLKDILKKPIQEWKNYLVNDFEEALFPIYPELQDIKKQLYAFGALYASLSGSGSALYAIFEHNYKLDLQNTFPKYFCWENG